MDAAMARMKMLMGATAVIPYRIFLQPHPDGRTEIVAEPYSKKELRENQDEIYSKREWAAWDIGKTKTHRALLKDQRL